MKLTIDVLSGIFVVVLQRHLAVGQQIKALSSARKLQLF